MHLCALKWHVRNDVCVFDIVVCVHRFVHWHATSRLVQMLLHAVRGRDLACCLFVSARPRKQ